MNCGLRITGGLPANFLLGRWRLCLELFGRVFLEDVGAEPSSVLNELGRFDVKEIAFRREMDRLKNTSQRDFTLEVRVSHCLLQMFNWAFFFLLIFLERREGAVKGREVQKGISLEAIKSPCQNIRDYVLHIRSIFFY